MGADMIVGVGIDLIAVGKIAQHVHRAAYLRKVFTSDEIVYCQQFSDAGTHFAGMFAAKEAFMKAIGAGIRQGVWFTHIEILHHAGGAPHVRSSRKAQDYFQSLGARDSHVSISHSAGMAVGLVILTG